MLAGQFTNCSAHQILNHTLDPACRGSVAPGHPITEEMTQGSAVSNSRQRLHPVLFLRVKHEEQAAPCWGRLRTSTPGLSRPPAVSVLLPLDYSSVSLRWARLYVRESEPLLRFHFLCTHSLKNVTVLRQLRSGKWRWHKPQCLLTHSTRINGFQFLFLVIKVAFNSHNWNKIHLISYIPNFKWYDCACIGLSFYLHTVNNSALLMPTAYIPTALHTDLN